MSNWKANFSNAIKFYIKATKSLLDGNILNLAAFQEEAAKALATAQKECDIIDAELVQALHYIHLAYAYSTTDVSKRKESWENITQKMHQAFETGFKLFQKIPNKTLSNDIKVFFSQAYFSQSLLLMSDGELKLAREPISQAMLTMKQICDETPKLKYQIYLLSYLSAYLLFKNNTPEKMFENGNNIMNTIDQYLKSQKLDCKRLSCENEVSYAQETVKAEMLLEEIAKKYQPDVTNTNAFFQPASLETQAPEESSKAKITLV